MSRRNARRTVSLLACAALAACVVNLSFDMDKQGLALQAAAATALSQSAPVNLADYSEITSHKGDIRSLDLDSVDVTIMNVNAGNLATTLDATLYLRKEPGDPPSQDVRIGELQGFPVMQHATRRISGNPQLDAFLLERLNDGGTFYLIVSGQANDRLDVVVDVDLHASMAYDTGWF